MVFYRAAYFDLQTFNIHYPRDKPKYDPEICKSISEEKARLATVPPYREYTSEHLKYLPLKTVSCGPLGVLERGDTSDPVFPDSSDSETEVTIEAPEVNPVVPPNPTSNSKPSSSSRSSKSGSKPRRSAAKRQAANNDNGIDEKSCSSPKSRKSSGASSTAFKEELPSISVDSMTNIASICGICFKNNQENKFNQQENLISCSQCTNAGHPTCLELTDSIVSVIMTYNWQCMECKVCMTCKSATDEENLMFCDNCDRGYHSYCVGMTEIPSGRWVCEICGDCVSCLKMEKELSGEWKQEFTRPRDKTEPKFLQRHCDECSRRFNKGEFCPICLKVCFLFFLRVLHMIEGERVKRKVRALKLEKKIRRLKLSVEEKKHLSR